MDNLDLNQIEREGLGINFKFAGGNLGQIVTAALPYVFFAAGAILLFMIISAGLTLMTAAGDQKAIAGAKARLTHALIGFVIVFLAYWIAELTGILLGIPDISGIFRGGRTCIPSPGNPCPVP